MPAPSPGHLRTPLTTATVEALLIFSTIRNTEGWLSLRMIHRHSPSFWGSVAGTVGQIQAPDTIKRLFSGFASARGSRSPAVAQSNPVGGPLHYPAVMVRLTRRNVGER
jgi:hypothetical protein